MAIFLPQKELKYSGGTSEFCPHCGVNVQFLNNNFIDWQIKPLGNPNITPLGIIKEENIPNNKIYFYDQISKERQFFYTSKCPHCDHSIVCLGESKLESSSESSPIDEDELTNKGHSIIESFIRLIYPTMPYHNLPSELPNEIKEDYSEAIETLQISEKASAALSRRCLQLILNENGFPGTDLSNQIDKVLLELPNYISKHLDAIRAIGNISAHPTKSKETGDILDVAPDEAQLLLDVLEQLINLFYIQQKKSKEITDRVNKKLKEAGKPPLKCPK